MRNGPAGDSVTIAGSVERFLPLVSFRAVLHLALCLLLFTGALVRPAAAQAPDESANGLAAPSPLGEAPEPVETPPRHDDEPIAPSDDPDDVRYRDASANRTVWFPSAETNPSGTFFAALYELVGLQLGYAVSDRIELSLAGVPPFDGFPYAYELSCKANVFRGSVLRVALLGSLGVFVSDEREVAVGGRVAGTAQLCLTEHCGSYTTLSLGVLVTDHIDRALPLALGIGLVARVHRLVALVVESIYGRVQQSFSDEIFVLNYGVRIGTDLWSLDVGLTRPFVEEIAGTPLAAGVPWLAFAIRFGYEPAEQVGRGR
jgi:hypothetical protein